MSTHVPLCSHRGDETGSTPRLQCCNAFRFVGHVAPSTGCFWMVYTWHAHSRGWYPEFSGPFPHMWPFLFLSTNSNPDFQGLGTAWCRMNSWSNMDPLSALSVTCSVIQFIDFGAKVLEDELLQSRVDEMWRFSLRFKVEPNQNQTEGERAICQLATQCQTLSNEILETLEKTTVADSRSIFVAL